MLLKHEHEERRRNQRSRHSNAADLPSKLTLASPGVLPLHDGNGVDRCANVDRFEYEIPGAMLLVEV